jgi:hypothetical protein
MVSTHPHVGSNMPAIDVLAVNLSIQLLLILLETSKPLVTVGNVKTTIQGSLQQQKDLHLGLSSKSKIKQRCYNGMDAR